MKETLRQDLPNGMGLSIIEVDNPIAKTHFHKRFQVALVVDNKKHLPKLKKKFYTFESSDYFYRLKSDVTGENVHIDAVLYHEKLLCDKSYEDCTKEINKIKALSNNPTKLKRKLKRRFAW